MSIDATRAAIQEAQDKVGLMLAARNDLADAIGTANDLVDKLDLPSASRSAIGHLGTDAFLYVVDEGDGSEFEFDHVKEHVDEFRAIFETLVQQAPVPA
jgi:hypothetical protein